MARVPSPIGAYELPEHPSAENPDADPDLDRWQADRWAPHPLEPETGESRSFARGDGSFHDRTLAAQDPQDA